MLSVKQRSSLQQFP